MARNKKIEKLMLTAAAVFVLGSNEGWCECSATEIQKATITALTPAYRAARDLHTHVTGKQEGQEDLSTASVSQLSKEILRLLGEAKTAKCPTTTIPAQPEGGERDFEKEYEELTHKLHTGGLSQKEEAALNIQLEKLVAAASKAGKPIGGKDEAADEKKKAEEDARLQKEAREAAKAAEKKDDLEAYQTRDKWLHELPESNHLAALLKLPNPASALKEYVDTRLNLQIADLIDKETSKEVLRTHRHVIRLLLSNSHKIPDFTPAKETRLNDLESKITFRLGNLGVKPASVSLSVNSFTTTPEEKGAFEKFQYVWKKAEGNKDGSVYSEINKKRNDVIFSYIISSPEELKTKTFDNANLKNILMSQATLLELEAFVYALSQAKISVSSNDLNKRLSEVRDQIKGIKGKSVKPGFDVNQRAKEEEKLSEGFVPQHSAGSALPPSLMGKAPPPPSNRPVPLPSPSTKDSGKSSGGPGAFLEELKRKRAVID